MIKRIEIDEVLKWWENKRLWFNFIVGITGIVGLFIYSTFFNLFDFISLSVYGFIANIFYSLGVLVELFDLASKYSSFC